jgi:hypothetical protein
MNAFFRSFAIGLTLSLLVPYLILVAQFRSFLDSLTMKLALRLRSVGLSWRFFYGAQH